MKYVENELQEKINKKIESLTEKELSDVLHYLDLLFPEKSEKGDEKMHNIGRFLGFSRHENGYKMSLGIQNANFYGVAQGGAIYTLADVALGYSIMEQLEDGAKLLTQELKMNFIKKGEGSYLYALPKVLHFGNKSVVAECSVKDDKGQLVAHGLGTFSVLRDS